MPIKDKSRYPADWDQISLRIRARSKGRCECIGECRREHAQPKQRCQELNGMPAVKFFGRVVLTVGHMDHQPENCDPSNLRAWCQRCHLAYDHELHMKNAAATRAAKKAAKA